MKGPIQLQIICGSNLETITCRYSTW